MILRVFKKALIKNVFNIQEEQFCFVLPAYLHYEEIMNKKKFVQLDSIVLTIIYVRLIYKDFRVQVLAYMGK